MWFSIIYLYLIDSRRSNHDVSIFCQKSDCSEIHVYVRIHTYVYDFTSRVNALYHVCTLLHACVSRISGLRCCATVIIQLQRSVPANCYIFVHEWCMIAQLHRLPVSCSRWQQETENFPSRKFHFVYVAFHLESLPKGWQIFTCRTKANYGNASIYLF